MARTAAQTAANRRAAEAAQRRADAAQGRTPKATTADASGTSPEFRDQFLGRNGGRTQQGNPRRKFTGQAPQQAAPAAVGRTQQGTQAGQRRISTAAPVAQPEPAQPAPAQVTRVTDAPAADAAGLLLGLFAYPLILNLLRGGPSQARAWLAAKFINQTSGSGAGTPPPPALPAPGAVKPAPGTGTRPGAQ